MSEQTGGRVQGAGPGNRLRDKEEWCTQKDKHNTLECLVLKI